MKIAAGADHGGYAIKEAVVRRLRSQGHEVVDVGTDSAETSVDYPTFAHRVAQMVATDEVDRGLLVCGTGLGVAISANKVPAISRDSRVGHRVLLLWLGGHSRKHTMALFTSRVYTTS